MNFSGPINNFSGGGLGLYTKGFIIKMSPGNDMLLQKSNVEKDNGLEHALTVGKKIDYKEGKKYKEGVIKSFIKNSDSEVIGLEILDEFEKIKRINITQVDIDSSVEGPNDSSRNAMVNVSTIGISEGLDFLSFIHDLQKI